MMSEPFTFVLFGATGDLSRKKILPALAKLMKRQQLGEDFRIIGIGRRPWNNEELIEQMSAYWSKATNHDRLAFSSKTEYLQMDFDKKEDYEKLAHRLGEIESKQGSQNRLYYFATLPDHFLPIVQSLKGQNLVKVKKNSWTRFVFEKPFGRDQKSAKKLDASLQKILSVEQLYYIDHYLGKEWVQNIPATRFANWFLKPLWNKQFIDHVQINLLENFGIEERGHFYDQEGAIRDVVQNHVLQVLSLVAMKEPKQLNSKEIQREKEIILKNTVIRPQDVVKGQYEGYLEEKGVNKYSTTETFAAMKARINTPEWKGVPFYIRTGKCLQQKFASVYVEFKHDPKKHYQGSQPNFLLFQIQPNEGAVMQINVKVPARKNQLQSAPMTFCHECTFGPTTPEAYENLLLDAVQGDHSFFASPKEIELAWKIVDPIIGKKKQKPHSYAKNTMGPKEATKLMNKDGRDWWDHVMEVNQNLPKL